MNEKRDCMNDIGERIRQVRLARKLSRTQLGDRLGLNHPDIRMSAYENNKVYPRNNMIKKMADALGVSSEWLITGVFDKKTLDSLVTTDFFSTNVRNSDMPQHYFQLLDFLEKNTALLSICLSNQDITELSKLIYDKVYKVRGTLKEIQPFITTDEYNEYCYEEQEKMDDLIARGEGYFDENNEFHYEPNMQELIENGDAYYDENGFFQYTENTEEDI